MQPKPVAIIAAMPVELAPLIDSVPPLTIDGVELFELPYAEILVGGIGEKFARKAAQVAIEHVQPKTLLSAGLVGAVSPGLKVGEVGRIREVVQAATGERYAASGEGDWVLVTSSDISDAAAKHELLTKYGADVVDMEAAAVARVAREHGLEFAAIKAISDDAEFLMPPLNRFVSVDGKFETRKFLMYIALHPKWWTTLGKIKANSELASRNLCQAIEHLLRERAVACG